MCGIAGIISLDARPWVRSDYSNSVSNMTSAMRRRGPDGVGYYEGDGVALGHARLSIIDLEGGDQPLYNEDDSIVGVVNGEIYDYKSLQIEVGKRHRLRTRSDSELLIHLWEESGAGFRHAVNGMYAYALYDKKNRQLEVGIDPAGIKPLYWTEQRGMFIFASELRGLIAGLASFGIPAEDDPKQIHSFLLQGWVPPGRTGLKDVFKLRPGESICVGPESARQHSFFEKNSSSIDLTTSNLESTLHAAVKRQLVADVPVGIFLSGGIDSSLLTAIASNYQQVSTFTVRFEGGEEADRVNEADIAAAVAAHVGCPHHEVTVSDALLQSRLSSSLEAQGDLIADPAVLPLGEISALAAESVKVCLTGDGGDEMFGGYLRHTVLSRKLLLQRSPLWMRRQFDAIRRKLPLVSSNGLSDKFRKLRLLLGLLLDEKYVGGPFSGDFEVLLNDCRGARWGGFPDMPDDVVDCEIQGPLSSHMLVKTDRVSMWHGLEVRVPFLDDDVIDLARITPWSDKVSGMTGKLPLRRVASKLIPADIAAMPKRGFRVPIVNWFRRALHTEVRCRLLDNADLLDDMISKANVEMLLEDHRADAADHSMRIWTLLVLLSWRSSNSSVAQRVSAGMQP